MTDNQINQAKKGQFYHFKKMNTESQVDADVNLYFVVPNKYKSEDDCAEDMWHAYNVSKKISFQEQKHRERKT